MTSVVPNVASVSPAVSATGTGDDGSATDTVTLCRPGADRRRGRAPRRHCGSVLTAAFSSSHPTES